MNKCLTFICLMLLVSGIRAQTTEPVSPAYVSFYSYASTGSALPFWFRAN